MRRKSCIGNDRKFRFSKHHPQSIFQFVMITRSKMSIFSTGSEKTITHLSTPRHQRFCHEGSVCTDGKDLHSKVNTAFSHVCTLYHLNTTCHNSSLRLTIEQLQRPIVQSPEPYPLISWEHWPLHKNEHHIMVIKVDLRP
jgi:hypothetical protein